MLFIVHGHVVKYLYSSPFPGCLCASEMLFPVSLDRTVPLAVCHVLDRPRKLIQI